MKKKQFLRIEKMMSHGEVMCVNEISKVTGISEMDVLRIISKNSLIFKIVVVPLESSRDYGVYYKLDSKRVDYFRKNRYEAEHFCRYLDVENLV